MSQPAEMLQVEHVTHAFGGVKAMDDCTFVVPSGQITALIAADHTR